MPIILGRPPWVTATATGLGPIGGPGGSDAAGVIAGIGSAQLRQPGTPPADGALADADHARGPTT